MAHRRRLAPSLMAIALLLKYGQRQMLTYATLLQSPEL